LNDLTPDTGKEIIRQWSSYGLKGSTMKVTLRILCQCLNQAKKLEYLKENPFSSIKTPKEKKKRIRALTQKEQRGLEKAALKEGGVRGLPTYLALYTGLRIGEIATRCLEAQGDILSVSAMLGHTSTQLTLDTYADSMIEQRMQVIYQMEKIIQ